MVINFHVHMMRYQVDWPKELGEFYIKEMFQGDCWLTGKPWRPEDFCVTVERLIKDMDAGKIDKSVVLGVGYMPWNAYDPNSAAYVKSMVDKYPERLVGFYTGNPTGGYEEAKRLEEAVTKYGLRGLKMLPSYNYVALNDRRIWPLYEAAQALKVPVMVHTGWSAMPKGKMLAYDHPLYLEDVMVDFPDLSNPTSLSGSAPRAVTMISGIPSVLLFPRKKRASSTPLMPGSIQSMRIRWGSASRTSSSACSAVPARIA